MPSEAPWGFIVNVSVSVQSRTSHGGQLTFLSSIYRFAKSVTKSTTRIETLLKVIIPPEVSEMPSK